jgi:hypothetical protein
MADNSNNEPNQDGLENLPEAQRKETQQMLDEIAAEDAAKAGDKPKGDEEKPKEGETGKPDESKKDDPKKPDGKPEDKKEKEKPEGRRPAKLIPAWVHERAKEDWTKQEAKLKADIEALSKGKPSSEGGKDESKASKEARDAGIKALAEKHGYSEEFVRDVLSMADENKGVIPPEVAQKLSQVDKLSEEREIQIEEAQFSQDFDKIVLPLIKAEYGDNVPQNVIVDIKEDLKGLAYSTEYSKVPYEVIYNGTKDFRSRVPDAKKGAEDSRPGQGGVNDGKEAIDLTKPLSDEVVATLSDKQFETYSNNMVGWEKSNKKP